MTTGGERQEGPPRTVIVAALIALLASLAVLTATAGPAQAVDPAAKASIVFENGGRIISIDADGGNREILTRKNGTVVAEQAWDAFIPVEDSNPSISPDGSKLLFERKRDLPKGKWRTELIVADRDGSNQKAIVSWKSPVITWLGWDAHNRVVAGRYDYFVKGKVDREKYWVVSFDQGGGDRRVLLSRETKQSDFSNYDRFLSAGFTATGFSPDGRSMLYVDGGMRPVLKELDIESGKSRVLLRGVNYATYSPDGESLVVVPAYCSEGDSRKVCDGWKRGIWTVNIDGSERKRITTVRSDDPVWSPDGDRIAFSSWRNFPGGGFESLEIYSVGTDGSCLTWLTNGSPESVSPSWAPEALDSSAGRCGAAGRRPLVEVTPSKRTKPASPRLWAGPELRGRLLSSVAGIASHDVYYYADCAYYDPATCREGLVVESISSCRSGDTVSGVDLNFNGLKSSVARGAWMYTSRGRKGNVSGILMSGRSIVTFGDSYFLRTGGIPSTVTDLNQMVRQLRRVGKRLDPSSKLPGPVVRKGAVREYERVLRLYRKTGSIAATAKLLGIGRNEVKIYVDGKGVFNRLKPFKEEKCGK